MLLFMLLKVDKVLSKALPLIELAWQIPACPNRILSISYVMIFINRSAGLHSSRFQQSLFTCDKMFFCSADFM